MNPPKNYNKAFRITISNSVCRERTICCFFAQKNAQSHTKKNRKTQFFFLRPVKRRQKSQWNIYTFIHYYYIQNSPYSLLKSKVLYSLTNQLKKSMCECANNNYDTVYVNMLPTNIVLKVLFSQFMFSSRVILVFNICFILKNNASTTQLLKSMKHM